MAASTGWVVWEALKNLRGMFGGDAESGAVALTQQTASTLLPSRDDEAIQLALDAALAEMADGPLHLANVGKVRTSLESHQRTDWRKNMTSLKMTERFEQVVITETTTQQTAGPEAVPAPAGGLAPRRRGGAQTRIERKFDHRPRDYEWTPEDPRIKHLILVSTLVSAGKRSRDQTAEQNGIAKARSYLLAAGLIEEKSLAQQGSEVLSSAKETVVDTAYHFVAARQLGAGGEYRRIMAMPEGDVRNQVLSQALDRKSRDVQTDRALAERAGLPLWFKVICVAGPAIVIVLVLI